MCRVDCRPDDSGVPVTDWLAVTLVGKKTVEGVPDFDTHTVLARAVDQQMSRLRWQLRGRDQFADRDPPPLFADLFAAVTLQRNPPLLDRKLLTLFESLGKPDPLAPDHCRGHERPFGRSILDCCSRSRRLRFSPVETHKPASAKARGVNDSYRTVAGRGQARFEISGSEFIGHVSPAETVAEAEQFVDAIREEYADATHNVPAYRVRAQPLREYASDDSEPSGSAGKPALNVLEQEELENVVAVVTRYYGGTKLGVGGLARAYARGVKAALEDTEIVEQRPHERFSITVEYDDSGSVRGILESEAVEFEASYEADVSFEVRVPKSEGGELRDRIRSATSGRAEFSE